MMTKATKLFFCLLLIISTAGNAQPVRSKVRGITSYPESVHRAVELINCLPESRDLLERIEREGSVSIEFTHENSEFEAYWMGGSRTILLNPHCNRTLGQQVCSIIFELHNALAEDKMERLVLLANQGTISRGEYVEGIERIEHSNALEACRILDLGIKKRLFPRDAAALCDASFDDYFARQKQAGHSDFIARDFNRIAPQRAMERDDASHYLAIRRDLESRNRDRIVSATLKLQEEFNKFDSESRPNERKRQLFYRTFAGNPIFDTLAR